MLGRLAPAFGAFGAGSCIVLVVNDMTTTTKAGPMKVQIRPAPAGGFRLPLGKNDWIEFDSVAGCLVAVMKRKLLPGGLPLARVAAMPEQFARHRRPEHATDMWHHCAACDVVTLHWRQGAGLACTLSSEHDESLSIAVSPSRGSSWNAAGAFDVDAPFATVVNGQRNTRQKKTHKSVWVVFLYWLRWLHPLKRTGPHVASLAPPSVLAPMCPPSVRTVRCPTGKRSRLARRSHKVERRHLSTLPCDV